jgi:hypothetical protein
MAAAAIARDAIVELYLPDGSQPDDFDRAPATDFSAAGRFACGLCAANRDDADAAERELDRAQARLAAAEALLKFIGRVQQRPAAAAEGLDETPYALALIGFAQSFAAIKARVDIYFQGVRGA